jgi:small-conductance mechanosensitive channel
MQGFFRQLVTRIPISPHAMVLRTEDPYLLGQIGIVLVAAVVAFWAGIRILPQLDRLALHRLPKNWMPTAVRVCHSVAAPLLWLLLLWLVSVIAGATDQPLGFVNGVADLLLAWVVIRLFSFAVRSPAGSAAISIVVWGLAALAILGLTGPITRVLDRSAIQFGTVRLSALTVIHAVFVLVILLWLSLLLFRFLERQIVNSRSLTPSLQVLFIQLLKILLPAFAIITALAAVGVNLTAFTVASGAIGLGLGFGLQRLVANLVAGLSLLVGKTIKPGDIIEYKDSYGWVTAMGATYVTLRTRDGVEHLVPNDYFLENGVENWSYSDIRLRLHIPIGIAFDSDVRKAIALCIEAAKSAKRVLDSPDPICLLKGFGDSSVNLEIRIWIDDPRNGTANVKSEVLLAVWDRFKAAGITIPFPQRDVHIVSMPSKAELP